MTYEEAKIVLGVRMCDKCVNRKCESECDYAKAHDMAIKAIDQVAKLRELRNITAEKEQVYANESNDSTMYFAGLANAYCTINALIDEILGSE